MATASNKQALVFDDNVTTAWTAAPTHFGIWDHATATGEVNFYGGGMIAGSSATPGVGARVAFAVGGVRIRVTGGTNESQDEAVNGLIDKDLYVSLHSGDPGTTGASEITRLAASQNTARRIINSGTTHANGWTVVE